MASSKALVDLIVSRALKENAGRQPNLGTYHECLLSYLNDSNVSECFSSSSKLMKRLRTNVEDKSLYQIHQDLRNIYFRFVNKDEKLETLIDLLYLGGLYLLESGELITGQDIATLCLEVMTKYASTKNQPPLASESNHSLLKGMCLKLSSLVVYLPDTELGQQKFLAEALKTLKSTIIDKEMLHYCFAEAYLNRGIYANARYHFLYCASEGNADEIGTFLMDYHRIGASKSEVDLFITQFILHVLCLQCPLDSTEPSKVQKSKRDEMIVNEKSRRDIRSITEKIFSSYTRGHPQLKSYHLPHEDSLPLLNFTYFILSILDSKVPETKAYRLLCDIYKRAWSRDPNFQGYLNRIGAMYFGTVDPQQQQQQQQSGGLFNNILMSLFENSDDDGDGSDDEADEYADDHLRSGNNVLLNDELD